MTEWLGRGTRWNSSRRRLSMLTRPWRSISKHLMILSPYAFRQAAW